jgi:hypothetical protein
MTRQRTLSRSLKPIAGAALVGLGLLILSVNLYGAAAQMSCPLGTTAGEALGVCPTENRSDGTLRERFLWSAR